MPIDTNFHRWVRTLYPCTATISYDGMMGRKGFTQPKCQELPQPEERHDLVKQRSMIIDFGINHMCSNLLKHVDGDFRKMMTAFGFYAQRNWFSMHTS